MMAGAGMPIAHDADAAGMIAFVNALQQEIAALRQEIGVLRGVGDGQPKDEKEMQLKDLKSFQSLPKWNGDEKEFADYEFKLHQFLQPFKFFEKWLDWVKDLEEEPTAEELNTLAMSEKAKDAKVDILWMNRQIYSVLSLTTVDTPLQTCKGVKELDLVRGALAWFRMTREVAGKTGVRLERLADKVHKPKKMTAYADGLRILQAWEQDCKDLAKIEGQDISKPTKRTTLNNMLPADLHRDL